MLIHLFAVGLVVGAAWSLLNGAVFLLVGRKVANRALVGEERRANDLFALFWQSLGGLSIAGGLFNLAAAWGVRDLALYTVLLYTLLLVLCLALWGLAYYLLYLFTGSTRWLVPLALFYGAYFFAITYLVVWANPVDLGVGRWQTTVVYERDLNENPATRWFVLLLLAPQIVGAFAYMSLLFRVPTRLQRYRISLVSLAILVWFGGGVVASALGVNTTDWWQALSRLVSLTAAFTVLLAFSPPQRWRSWLEHVPPMAALGGGYR